MDTQITVDVNKVIEFIEDEHFINYMLNLTDDVSVPAFILQAVYNEINRLKEGNS